MTCFIFIFKFKLKRTEQLTKYVLFFNLNEQLKLLIQYTQMENWVCNFLGMAKLINKLV